jgi:hypothetical protein
MDDERKQSEPSSIVGWRVIVTVVLVIVLLWVGSAGLIHLAFGAEGRGTFGDMFGAINALFSGLAFASLIYAIFLQREELRLQRTELTATRQVLESQKQEASRQNETLAQQTFDNTFFQLLRLQGEIVSALDVREGRSLKVIAENRDCFRFFFESLGRKFQTAAVGMPANTDLELLARIKEAYAAFFADHEKDVGRYFRSLYNLVKFIDRSTLSSDGKRIYTNLVRAQLSSFEQLLLFYNCLSPLGSKKFKPLVERYSLLKTVNKPQLIHGECDLKLYDPSAFT